MQCKALMGEKCSGRAMLSYKAANIRKVGPHATKHTPRAVEAEQPHNK